MGDIQVVTAAIYCRISLAVLNNTTKVDDQERQCREVAARRGWKVAEVYTDNSKSAWKRNRKRDGWDKMLAAANEGRFDAIISYWGDRLIRQPRDLEDLLDLREVRNIKIASIMGEYDIENKDHRMMMRWEVARACNESDTISQRKKNGLARLRREGLTRPGGPGGRCFGFEKDGRTHVPAEAEAVRRAAAAVLAGQSLGSVSRELSAGGVTTTSGRPITTTALSRILSYPRMAALMPDGVSPAAWEPVLERAQWEAIQVMLDGKKPDRRTGRGAQSLLAAIARCGVCGGPLWTGRSGGSPTTYIASYKCMTRGCGKVSRSRDHLDAYVTGRVVTRLAHANNPAPRSPDLPGLAAEFRALTEARTETAAAIENGSPHLDLLLGRLKRIEERREQLRELAGESARDRLVREHAGMTREQFEAMPLATRRALVAACFEVVVLPASARGPGFRPEDVRLTPL